MSRIAEAERPARRQRLIDAAWRCLARGSYADLRVEDVCAEASLSKGSFYGYFESKRELFYTLVDEDSRLLEEAAAGDPTAESAAARLLDFAAASLRAAEDQARLQLRSDIWAAAANDPVLEQRVSAGIARRRMILRRCIEDAVDAGALVDVPANALASLMLALADGLALHRRLDAGGFRSNNVHRVLQILLPGLEQPQTTAPTRLHTAA